jgi:hypothetical protein
LNGFDVIPLQEFDSNTKTIQIVTEVNLERDLSYYKIQIPYRSFLMKKEKVSVPDIMIVYKEWAILAEIKFFMSYSTYQLFEQLKKQTYILDIIRNVSESKIRYIFQIAITPYGEHIPEFFSISWEEIYNQLMKTIPNNNYFMERLNQAILRLG